MDKKNHIDVVEKLDEYLECNYATLGSVFLFGHCKVTLTLIDELLNRGIIPIAILDNSNAKEGMVYRNVPVCKPENAVAEAESDSVVFIATRFFEAMRRQLIDLDFKGKIIKLVDYNSYADYSLSDETILAKKDRCVLGKEKLLSLKKKYPHSFYIFCPFAALGDIYICMSYLPEYLKRINVDKAVVCVVGISCEKVAMLFDIPYICVEAYAQEEIDAMIQASLYLRCNDTFIAHQDRPYVVGLHRALKEKCIPLEKIYRCGIFGLDDKTSSYEPTLFVDYPQYKMIDAEKAIILSPYAKSVANLPHELWKKIAEYYLSNGYQVFTNVYGDEKAIEGTMKICPNINELRAVVERAGIFIGIRSGLCDILRTANCRKIALYPDYHYSDTKWKAIDMYRINGFENYVYENDNKILEVL